MKNKMPDTSNIINNRNRRIYLAGPEVFLPDAVQLGQRKKDLCSKYGFQGVFPIDAEVNVQSHSPHEIGLLISSMNEDLIRSCKFIIANITPFRGLSADVGTSYEMGFARGFGLVVSAYTNIEVPFSERVVLALSQSLVRDRNGRLRDQYNMEIEEFGMVDNLMLEGGVSSSGGILVTSKVPENDLFTDLRGFEQCLQHTQKVMNSMKEQAFVE